MISLPSQLCKLWYLLACVRVRSGCSVRRKQSYGSEYQSKTGSVRAGVKQMRAHSALKIWVSKYMCITMSSPGANEPRAVRKHLYTGTCINVHDKSLQSHSAWFHSEAKQKATLFGTGLSNRERGANGFWGVLRAKMILCCLIFFSEILFQSRQIWDIVWRTTILKSTKAGYLSKPNNPIMIQMKKKKGFCLSREHWRKRGLTSVAAVNAEWEGAEWGEWTRGMGKGGLPAENTRNSVTTTSAGLRVKSTEKKAIKGGGGGGGSPFFKKFV